MNEIVSYILSFLLYGEQQAVRKVGYTADQEQWHQYTVIIVPNGHLGKEIVLPDLSTPRIELIPSNDPTNKKKRYIIHTDIVYNTFFFISRAEELINSQRDEHGRFLAEYSLLGKNNRLLIPSVDEYGRTLLKLLECPLPAPAAQQIYLTHDVDSIDQYRHLRGFVGGIVRKQYKAVIRACQSIENDPAYTFPWLMSQDAQLPQAKAVYFIKDTKGKGYDYPQYNLKGKDCQHLIQTLQHSQALIGLHSSYYGITQNPKSKIHNSLHRSHYLRCSIDQMQRLVEHGITDDFTMMFPDHVGFRLQTCRPVRWINPKTMQLTSLLLHPLTIMDCTLSNHQYMNLNEDEAYFTCEQLFDKCIANNGEIVLLWHNTNPTNNPYHRSLYNKLIQLLKNLL